MINLEIWASGGGTNADAIATYFANNDHIRVASIGCNRREAGAFNVARKHAIASTYWNRDNWNSNDILSELADRKIHFIVLAGFLKLVPSAVTRAYAGRIMNIHPSLLPLYGGKNMYGEHVHNAVLAAKDTYTGITMHEVNEEFDKGKIIAQYTTSLTPPTEDLTTIQKKIQTLEHTHYAPTLEAWIKAKK